MCAAAGAALAATLGAAAVVRRDKPLHTRGTCYRGTFTPTPRDPGQEADAPAFCAAEAPVYLRVSAAMSLGTPWDIGGLALRLSGAGEGGGDADVLLATTGDGRLGRWLLRLAPMQRPGILTTLLPYDHGGRPLWLRAAPDGPCRWLLSSSTGRSWTERGLVTAAGQVPDEGVRFDPIGNLPAGLRWPRAVVALRAPAYAVARRLARV